MWAIALLTGWLLLCGNPANSLLAAEPDKPAESAVAAAPAAAEPAAATGPTNVEIKVMLDTMWVLITAMLVFFMNLGFAAVESGMCRSKNCVNILSKNFIVFAVSSLAFWILGGGVMFGDGTPYYGTSGLWFVSGKDVGPAIADASGDYDAINWTGIPLWAKFFFPLVFTGTAATIVSGAVAERIKYHTFIIFSFVMGTLIYPVVGHWVWGGGWLQSMGFVDFAGSTQVHSIGGWAALAGIILLGPRIGKHGRRQANRDSWPQHVTGHNRLLRIVVRLVRFQSRQHDGRRSRRDRRYLRDDQYRRRPCDPDGHDYRVVCARQTGSWHDAQWLFGRARRNHRTLCLRHRGPLRHHWRDCRCAGRVRGLGL